MVGSVPLFAYLLLPAGGMVVTCVAAMARIATIYVAIGVTEDCASGLVMFLSGSDAMVSCYIIYTHIVRLFE